MIAKNLLLSLLLVALLNPNISLSMYPEYPQQQPTAPVIPPVNQHETPVYRNKFSWLTFFIGFASGWLVKSYFGCDEVSRKKVKKARTNKNSTKIIKKELAKQVKNPKNPKNQKNNKNTKNQEQQDLLDQVTSDQVTQRETAQEETTVEASPKVEVEQI